MKQIAFCMMKGQGAPAKLQKVLNQDIRVP